MEYTSDMEAEGIAVATICNSDPNIKLYMLSKLTGSHFGLYAPKNVFGRVSNLVALNKDIPSLGVLKVDPALSDDEKGYIQNLSFTTLTNKNDCEQLVEVLEKYRQIRVLADSAEGIIKGIRVKDPDIVAIAENLEKSICKLRSIDKDRMFVHSGYQDNTDPMIDKIMNDIPPDLIPSGFPSFDSQTGGLQRTGLFLISAASGGGKSAMAIQLGKNFTTRGYSFCLVSLEMDKEQCLDRLLSNITKIPYTTIRLRRLSNIEKEKFMKRYNEFKQLLKENFCQFSVFVPEESFSLYDYKNILRPFNYDAIAFDHINLIEDRRQRSSSISNWEMLLNHSRDGKLMAGHLQSLVIMLSQMDDKTGELRYSKGIRDNCNNWWKWNYGEKEQTSHIIEVIQGKARDSKAFPFNLCENFENMEFIDPGVNADNSNDDLVEEPQFMTTLSDFDDENER